MGELARVGISAEALLDGYRKVLGRQIFLADRLFRKRGGDATTDLLRSVLGCYVALTPPQQLRVSREPVFSTLVWEVLHGAAAGSTSEDVRQKVELLAGFVGPDAASRRSENPAALLPGGLRLETGDVYRRIACQVANSAGKQYGGLDEDADAEVAFPWPDDPEIAGHFRGALQLLATQAPHSFADLQQYTAVVVPVRTPYASGFTLTECRGAVFVRPERELIDTVDHLVHENAHNKLHYIEDLFPLLEPGDDRLFDSPWRLDRRPMSGLVHGAYVFTVVAESLRQIASGRPRAADGLDQRIRTYQEQVSTALRTISEFAQLTSAGVELVTYLDFVNADGACASLAGDVR